MAKFTQEKRLLTVSDPFLLAGFSGREELSRLFHFQLELLSENDAIAPADVVGQKIGWAVNHVDRSPRFFHGYVNRFAAGGKAARGLRSYRAEVVPWLWFLTRTANCKIFQGKSADQIIQAIFDDLGFSDYKLSLNRPPAVRDYCVQYRETAFNFVSRLMEEEGIFYFFKHEEDSHTLVLADAKSAYADCIENEVEYAGGNIAPNSISAWEHRYEYRPGKWTQTDYNFETPSTSLLTSTSTVLKLPNISSYEIFDYPGMYGKTGEGTPLTKIRMEEEEAPYDIVSGASNCCTFTPAGKFKLSRHECEAEIQKYVLTGIQHHGTDPSYAMTGGEADYGNSFTCMPDSVVYRPARLTPKPSVQGLQTAVIVGKAGEEIYTDKYGRVKVQFFWDRVGNKDESSSCWIRVAELWAGKTWGIVFNPRIGQEVIVDFLEGDPDRPIITGRVYNAEQMPPYDLPANQTQSGIKTRSSKGGTADNFNEIRFEDKKGSEEIVVHAERMMNTTVEVDQTVQVLHNRKLTVGGAKNNSDPASDGTLTETIEGNHIVTIQKGQQIIEIQKDSQSIFIDKGDRLVQIDEGQDTLTLGKGGRTVKMKTDDTLDVSDGDIAITVAKGKMDVTAKQSITLGVTPASVKLEPSAITLSIGPSSIKLEPTAITIAIGPNTIKLDMTKILLDGLMLTANGQIQTEVKAGLMASFGGACMNKLGGGAIVMIG